MSCGKEKTAAVLSVGCAFVLTAIVLGAWREEAGTENILTTAGYRTRIIEEYEPPSQVHPSESVTKRVSVKNEGSVDILVRVSITKEFGTQTAEGFVKEEALDPEVIEITYEKSLWEEKEDGWFYYKKVLPAGKTTEKPLMKSFRLSEDLGNAYKGKEARIIVCLESVQAEAGAAALWKISEEAYGITKEHPGKATGVEFLGKEKGFRIEAEKTDLFASFKDLLPGCSRTQTVTVKNSSQSEAEIFLQAKEETKESSGKVQKLMEEYAVIEVSTSDGKKIYQGPVCGKSENASMQKEISLGTFAAGESRRLVVKLSMDPEMDNTYADLTGKVTWLFGARGEDETEQTAVTAEIPQTGDLSAAERWLVLLTISGMIFLVGIWEKLRRSKRE